MKPAGGEPVLSEPGACVAFVCDEGYLFPTLVAAMQAREHAPRSQADVVVCLIGDRTPTVDVFAPVFARYDIRMELRPRAAIRGHGIHYARMFLPELIAQDYERYLYLDGDIQVSGDLSTLLALDLGASGLAASRDPMSYVAELDGPLTQKQSEYFRSIGIGRSALQGYFNSGVLYASADFWRYAAPKCLSLVASEGGRFRFPDQDALNIVVGGDYTRISSAWNFPIFLQLWSRFRSASWRIAHFMSNPRPWQLECRPWGALGKQPYLDIVASHPELRRYDGRFSAWRDLRYRMQQIAKASLGSHPWDTAAMESLLTASDRNCIV